MVRSVNSELQGMQAKEGNVTCIVACILFGLLCLRGLGRCGIGGMAGQEGIWRANAYLTLQLDFLFILATI